MKRALLLGSPPPWEWIYVTEPPYDAVVIGSLTMGQLLHFSQEAVLSALAEGMPVYLYRPGLPPCPHNPALAASLQEAQRRLRDWGVIFGAAAARPLVTARQAQRLRRLGDTADPNTLLTPLAKDILDA